jgi:hypothetical protein
MRTSLLFIAASLLMIFLIENSVDARSNEISAIGAKWWVPAPAGNGNDGPGKPVKKLAANKVAAKGNQSLLKLPKRLPKFLSATW